MNLPDVRQIAVVDLNSLRVLDTWKLKQARANFPMALDPGRGVIAIVFRNPPALVLLDRESGAERAYARRAATWMTCSSTGSKPHLHQLRQRRTRDLRMERARPALLAHCRHVAWGTNLTVRP